MSTDSGRELRIFCLCGQKMRVTERMYGRPGKCVECHRKIWVPRPEEIPEGVTEIYIRDHPEFLRRLKKHPSGAAADGKAKTPAKPFARKAKPEVARDRGTPGLGAVKAGASETDDAEAQGRDLAVDTLEPLRRLCSLETKIARRIDDLGGMRSGSGAWEEKARLAEVQGRVRAARAELDEMMRQRLMEAAIELASVQEQLNHAEMAVRVAELDYEEYQQLVARLRARRDTLERRQTNFRGWIAVHDVHSAGGYVEVSLDSVPTGPFQMVFGQALDEASGILGAHVEGLRRALAQRSLGEARLEETQRLFDEAEVPDDALRERRDGCLAERERAAAAVAFFRGRLEQAQQDIRADRQAADAALNLARGRLQVGELRRGQFDKIEHALVRARQDLARAERVLVRALSANSAQDVPSASGTFLVRLAHPGRRIQFSWQSVTLWIAALFVLLAIVTGLAGGKNAVALWREGGVPGAGLVCGPVLLALFAVIGGLAAGWVWRGRFLAMVWLVGVVGALVYVREAWYGPAPLGPFLRDGLRAGSFAFWLYGVGMAALGVGAAGILAEERRVAKWMAIAIVGVLIGTVVEFSDGFGCLGPKPAVDRTMTPIPDDLAGRKEVKVAIRNDGWRPMTLNPNPSMNASAAGKDTLVYALQRQSGDAWTEAEPVRALDVKGTPVWKGSGPIPECLLWPGESAQVTHLAAPGSYRVAVDGQIVDRFDVPAPPQPAPPPPAEPAATPATPGEPEAEVPAEAPPPRVVLELRGILAGADRDPQFSVNVLLSTGEVFSRTLSIGDVVYGDWVLTGYNPSEKTITVGVEGTIRIVHTGERISLDAPAKPETEGGDDSGAPGAGVAGTPVPAEPRPPQR